MNQNKVELVHIEGPTSIFITAEITNGGDLLLSGQDVGDAPLQIYGDLDYEYWLRIRAADKEKALLALIELSRQRKLEQEIPEFSIDQKLIFLLEKVYSGNPSVISELSDYLKRQGISPDFFCY